MVATRSFYGSKVSAELDFPGARRRHAAPAPDRLGACRRPGQRVGLVTRGGRRAVARATPRARRGDDVRRRRHHAGGLPALDRPRDRRQGERRDVRGARREDGRDALGLAAARRRGLDALVAPGRPVGQDREADGLPRLRDLGCRAASRRDEDVRARSSQSTPTPRPRSSTSRSTAPWPTCSTSPKSSRSSSSGWRHERRSPVSPTGRSVSGTG